MMKRIFIALCIIIPFALGVWQIFRLQLKSELISKIQSNIDQPPISLMENVTNKDEFVSVEFKCKYIEDKSIFLYNPSVYHGKTGFNLISACKLEDERTILVDQGFVVDKQSHHLAENELIVGIIIFPKKPHYFTPINDLDKNIWFNVNISESERFLNIKLENFYIKMNQQSKFFPIRGKFHANIPNNHLGYSITWFSLALAIFLISLRLKV